MKIYIHVGYPKNASTTFQTDIFPNINNAIYLGRKYNSDNSFSTKEVSEAFYELTMYDSIDCNLDKAIKIIHQYIDDESNNYEKLIISSEGFANNMSDRGVMAERLKSIFPDGKILIVIRNQMDALRSMYSFLVKQRGMNINISYGRPSVGSFEKWIVEQEKFIGRSFITTLKYYEYISVYTELFGRNNVTVIMFEELVRSPDLFYEKMGAFYDVNITNHLSDSEVPTRNKGPTRRETAYYRFRGLFPNVALSRCMPNVISNLWRNYLSRDSNVGQKEYLPPEIEKRLVDLYRKGNKMLQEELNIDIIKYGYKV